MAVEMTSPVPDCMSSRIASDRVACAGLRAAHVRHVFDPAGACAACARGLAGGTAQFLIGVALGIDGLAQACLQIPFRSPVGSHRSQTRDLPRPDRCSHCRQLHRCHREPTSTCIIVGRLVQGTGAVAAAIIALTADLTREEHRAKGMAMIGMSIGATFGAFRWCWGRH
jgi:MFS family permease